MLLGTSSQRSKIAAMEMVDRAKVAAELYAQGQSLRQVGRALGVSPATVFADLTRLGVARRPPPERATVERTCTREGCENRFRPTSRQLRAGYGKFCSRACDHEAHRIYPRPEARVCVRPGCDNTFTPIGAHAARGWGKYCSKRCSAISTGAHVKRRGKTIACASCGREVWRYAYEMREHNFCSLRCWHTYRWRTGVAIPFDFLTRPASRKKWLPRWAGRRGGRPVAATSQDGYEEKAALVRDLHALNPKLGERVLAARAELSRRQIRSILSSE